MGDRYQAENSYSDAELLALYREAVARVSVSGQSYQMNVGNSNRTFTMADLKYLWSMVETLEDRVNKAAAAAGGDRPVNYARMTRR